MNRQPLSPFVGAGGGQYLQKQRLERVHIFDSSFKDDTHGHISNLLAG